MWGFVFLTGIILILGHVRLYEMSLQIQEKQLALQQLQGDLGKEKKAWQQVVSAPDAYAEALGMYLPQPEEYIVVHVPVE